jgi:hypothetical protein
MYCVKCRRKTNTIGIHYKKTKNGHNMRVGQCSVCGIKKTQFVKEKTGGDIQKTLSKLPGLPWAKYKGEKHLPKYSYCGPGTRLDKQLDEYDNPKQGELPINRVDAACLRHDKAYRANDIRSRQKADIDLIQDLNAIQKPSLGERMGKSLTKKSMKAKILFGS